MRERSGICGLVLAVMVLLLLTGIKPQEDYEDLPDRPEIRKSGIEMIRMSEDTPEAVSAEEERLFAGGELRLLANQSASQMLSSVIRTKDGHVIVVDGGTPADADHLVETVQSMGGRVDAWLVTHLHNDHIGALTAILNMDQPPLEIENIYYSIADLSWYYEKDPTRADTAAVFIKALESVPEEKKHGDIRKGTEIAVGDATVTVMNRRYLFDHDSGNNASVAYTVCLNGVYIVYTGDMGQEAAARLIQDWDTRELKCDIIQMAHHGQGGADQDFYRIMRPKICLWPTPQWLWDNDNGGGPGSGSWLTATTRKWMEDLGVTRHYCIKDGDQILL